METPSLATEFERNLYIQYVTAMLAGRGLWTMSYTPAQ